MTDAKQRFEHLATTCGPRVLGYLARRAEPAADAPDIYQEVLVTTWRRLRSVPADDSDALGWMFGVARRCLANHRRGVVRRLAATERLRTLVDTAVQLTESDELVQQTLDALTLDDRELLTLVYWDGLSTEEAARALSINSATARKRLQRARQRLRQHLADDPLPDTRVPTGKELRPAQQAAFPARQN